MISTLYCCVGCLENSSGDIMTSYHHTMLFSACWGSGRNFVSHDRCTATTSLPSLKLKPLNWRKGTPDSPSPVGIVAVSYRFRYSRTRRCGYLTDQRVKNTIPSALYLSRRTWPSGETPHRTATARLSLGLLSPETQGAPAFQRNCLALP